MTNLDIFVLLAENATASISSADQRRAQPAIREAIVDSRITVRCYCAYGQTGMTLMPTRDTDDLRLHDLRTLSVVLRERNLTRAAELLDTAQPAISKILAKLRTHFGDPLVIRNGHAMQLTPKAVEMTGPLRNLLDASDDLRVTPGFDPSTSDRVFKLLVTDVGTIVFLPPLLTRMANEGGNLTLRAVPLDSRHFELKLESGEADLALGAFPTAPSGLRRQRLYFARYLSVARRHHPRLARLRTSAGFRTTHHIIVMASDLGHAAHRMVQHALEAEIAPERVLLRMSSFIAAAIIASRTDGVATVPEHVATHLAEQLGLETFKPPIQLPKYEIAQYWHERSHRDPGHRWLRKACFDLFAKSRPGVSKPQYGQAV
jgi:DNA-binding transcriptional LysR family regulator